MAGHKRWWDTITFRKQHWYFVYFIRIMLLCLSIIRLNNYGHIDHIRFKFHFLFLYPWFMKIYFCYILPPKLGKCLVYLQRHIKNRQLLFPQKKWYFHEIILTWKWINLLFMWIEPAKISIFLVKISILKKNICNGKLGKHFFQFYTKIKKEMTFLGKEGNLTNGAI